MEGIQISRWAKLDSSNSLIVESGVRPIPMCNSDGTGEPLLKIDSFGADVIRFGANEGVMNHTHEGDHILIVIKGEGFVECNKFDYPLEPGVCYMIPGNEEHAIKATTELVMIAVGNNHQALNSEARMNPVLEQI